MIIWNYLNFQYILLIYFLLFIFPFVILNILSFLCYSLKSIFFLLKMFCSAFTYSPFDEGFLVCYFQDFLTLNSLTNYFWLKMSYLNDTIKFNYNILKNSDSYTVFNDDLNLFKNYYLFLFLLLSTVITAISILLFILLLLFTYYFLI